MSADLRKILDDRIDHLDRHGRFEECAIVERQREQLFPKSMEVKTARAAVTTNRGSQNKGKER